MPNSMMFRRNCAIAGTCTSAPGVPNGMIGRPSRNRMNGLVVRRGRLPASTRAGWSGSSQDWIPRDETMKPRPGTIGTSVKPSLGMPEKTLPARSTTQM